MSEDIVVAKVRKIEVGTLWDWGKITLRHLTTVGAVLATLWVFAEEPVKGYAGEAIIELLKKEGLNPEDLAKVKDQAAQMAKDIDQVSKDSANIKNQLNDLQTSNDKLHQQVENTNRSIEKVEDLVGKLLTIQLQRVDMSSSPPGSGPVGHPDLSPQEQP